MSNLTTTCLGNHAVELVIPDLFYFFSKLLVSRFSLNSTKTHCRRRCSSLRSIASFFCLGLLNWYERINRTHFVLHDVSQFTTLQDAPSTQPKVLKQLFWYPAIHSVSRKPIEFVRCYFPAANSSFALPIS